MPRRRSPDERKEIAALVDKLFEMSPYEQWVDFATAARVHWASLSDWHTAKSIPDGVNLMRLIEAAGGLTNLEQTPAAPAHRLDARLESLSRTVETLLAQAQANGVALGTLAADVGLAAEALRTLLERDDGPPQRRGQRRAG